jgi:uncharacterized protein (TIGR00269 family)
MKQLSESFSDNTKENSCRRCGTKAEYSVTFPRVALCRYHFIDFLETRVKRTIERYHMIKEGDKILLALSGGKDSVTLLHILTKLLGETHELEAITIDLGITQNNYSDISLEAALENGRVTGTKVNIIRLGEKYGFTIDDAVSSQRDNGRSPCSICGTVKRYVLNREALQRGFDLVLTGHNLDDEATVLLSNLISGDLSLLARTYPYLAIRQRMVARGKPLSETPERETTLYAEAMGLAHVTIQCPYKNGASIPALKTAVLKMEEVRPGAMLSLYRSFLEKIRKSLEVPEDRPESKKVVTCKECGMPTSGSTCSFCKIRKQLMPNTSHTDV